MATVGSRQLLGKILLIAAAYLAAGKLGLLLAIPPGYATAVWPPSGIALGALVLWGVRCWPGVLLGSFLTNVLVVAQPSDAQALIAPAIIGVGAALQAVLGALLIGRFVAAPKTLARERDILGFFLLGGPVASLVNASVGVMTLRMTGQLPADAMAYSWWTWWSGDTIGALIFAPLMVMWFGGREWQGRRAAVTIPLMAAFAAAVVVFVYASRLEWQQIERHFHEDADDLTGLIERRIDLNIELLHSIGGLFVASRSVERDEFSSFASAMLDHHSDLQAVEWAERVPEARRAAFEASIRPHQPDRIGIFERALDGHRPADVRETYYSIEFVEPYAANRTAVGFDLGSEHIRNRMLEHARDTGEITATSPVELVQANGTHDGVLIFLPVYRNGSMPADLGQRREALMGFAIAAIRTHKLVGLALQEHPGSRRVRLNMFDAEVAATEATLLYGDTGAASASGKDGQREENLLKLRYRTTIDVAGRAWALEFAPTPAYLMADVSFMSWAVLAAGLVFSALIGAGALVVTGRTAVVEMVVKERTAELARINEQLTKADRLKSEFVSTISHELRTPLTSIRGSLGLMNGGALGELPEQVRKLVDIAYRNTDRLAILINDILDLEKIDSGEMSVEPTIHALPALIEQTVEANSGYAQSCNVRFHLHKPLPEVSVLADAHRLSQVMANLLSNAAKFSPSRSTIDIFASSDQGKVRVCVQDRGPGIPPEFQSRIFKRFSQADGSDSRAKGGTGLGLAISKALIEQMNGTIGYQTEVGKGTTFYFELPVAEG